MAQCKCSTGLIDLPSEVVETIISCLTAADKNSIMASCKRVAGLTLQKFGSRLRITKATRATGITKVLDCFKAKTHLEIICTSDQVEIIQPAHDLPESGLDLVLDRLPDEHLSSAPFKHHWDGITKVTIQGAELRCLVPQFIAAACPQLEQLKIIKVRGADGIFCTEPGDALPLTVCSNLRQLELTGNQYSLIPIDLPAAYHSSADIRHSLPGIDTLILNNPCGELIQAFATQLTRLELNHQEPDEMVRLCCNLQYLRCPGLNQTDNPASLKILDVYDIPCSNDDMEKLIQLPNLTKLSLVDLQPDLQDWSSRACPWQELHLRNLTEFTILANLNLSSLTELSFGCDWVVYLPEPSNPGSFAAVQQAVDNLARVGQIEISQRDLNAKAYFGEIGTITWDIPFVGNEHEHKAVELVRVAAQRVGPCKVCNCEEILHRPLVLDAVFEWGKEFIESVCLGNNYTPPPRALQQLQRLNKLQSLVFWTGRGTAGDQQWFGMEPVSISHIVRDAAQHYVIPMNKRLRMEFSCNHTYHSDISDAERLALIEQSIQGRLPAGSRLASIQLAEMSGNKLYTQYNRHCDARAFWVVVVEPSQ